MSSLIAPIRVVVSPPTAMDQIAVFITSPETFNADLGWLSLKKSVVGFFSTEDEIAKIF